MESGDRPLKEDELVFEEEKSALKDFTVKLDEGDGGDEKDPLDSSGNSEPQECRKEKKAGRVMRPLQTGMNKSSAFIVRNRSVINHVFIGVLIALYCAYFIGAMFHGVEEAQPLIILTASVLVIVLLEFLLPRCKRSLKGSCNVRPFFETKIWEMIRFWTMFIAASAFFLWLVISVCLRNPAQLVSLVGLALIVFLCVVFSKYPNDISWRPVVWGIALQFILGLLVLRTKAGYVTFKFIGDQVATFMRYSDYGSEFVFGKKYYVHLFAFKILPMVVFFSTVMNMLYYIGLMQWFIAKLSWITQKSLGTSAIESTVSVANIFVGMTEAPLVVRPYLNDLTKAEIHSVLTCGLGSIAFAVFGAFVEFGVDSVHLLTACVMSAPAGLAISRMLYPERKKSKFTTPDSLKLTEGTDRNIVEAAAVGASMSIGLVANIAANLIAFLALLAFINATLAWFGGFVGYPDLSFETICAYVFMPLAFLMGAEWEDCGTVGELFGVKTFLNEFIAYRSMRPYIEYRLAGNVSKFDVNGTAMFMSERSEVVAIHALCGFCNISSLGIIVGGLGTLMPERKNALAELALRALFGGILTCCMTASIASLLFVESVVETPLWSSENFTIYSALPTEDVSPTTAFEMLNSTLLYALMPNATGP